MGINCDKISSQEESESNTRRVPFPETRIIKSWVVSITTSHKQTETNWDWSNLLGCHTAILSVAWHPNRWLRKKLAHSVYIAYSWTSLHFDRRVSKARLEFDICCEFHLRESVKHHDRVTFCSDNLLFSCLRARCQRFRKWRTWGGVDMPLFFLFFLMFLRGMSYFSTAAFFLFFFFIIPPSKVFLSKSFWHLSKLDYGTGAEVNSSKQNLKTKWKKGSEMRFYTM